LVNQCLEHQHTARSPPPLPSLSSRIHSSHGLIRSHESGIHRNADNTDTPCTPSAPATLTTTATPTYMNDIRPASSNFSCPHCARNFNSHIGLVGHLRTMHTLRPQLQLTHRPGRSPANPSHGRTEPATSTHTSAWSVTCESIARRLLNQCLRLRHTVIAPTSTAITAPAHLQTAWAY
uniref:C2H2-type domain-containing protein n=1 Tax=Schistocephalus solidus TaxID=70667 RepID=A0A183TC69_SCHSO